MKPTLIVTVGLLVLTLIACAQTDTSTPAAAAPTATSANDLEAGSSRAQPASIGTSFTVKFDELLGSETFNARITLVEVIRGKEAADLISDPIGVGSTPKDGFEWLLAKLDFLLLEATGIDTAYDLNEYAFAAVSSDGKVYEPTNPNIGLPEPRLRVVLYSGAQQEGWIAFQVLEEDARLF